MAQNSPRACLRLCPVRAHCRLKFSAPFPGEKPDMTGAIPALSHRLRPRVLSAWAAAICLGAATTLLSFPVSSPAFARGPDGIADVAEKVIDAVVNISTTQTVEAKAGGGGGGSRRHAAIAAGFAVRGVLRRFLQEPPWRAGRRQGRRRRHAAAQDQFARLRLHRRHRRHRRDQQSRHCRRRRDQRHHE